MSRFFLVIVSAMMLSAAFAGCFSDDPDDDNGNDAVDPGNNNGDNNTTGNGADNNTTSEPSIAPTPAFTVSMTTYDEEGGIASNESALTFTAVPGGNVSFTFDGSESTDEDGTIQAYSWRVVAPDGTEHTNAGSALFFRVPNLRGSDSFGVYHATLKVLDDDDILNSAEFFVVLNYAMTFDETGGMTGPGTAACDDPRETKAGSEVEGTGVTPGSYGLHRVSVGNNATEMNISLTYQPGVATTMALYLLGPGVDEGDCGSAIATVESGDSPLTLTLSDGIDVPGSYHVRVELDGVSVDSYLLEAGVTYTAPSQTVDPDEPEEPEEE